MYTEADLWREVDRMRAIGRSVGEEWSHEKNLRLAREVLSGTGRDASQIRNDARNRIAGNPQGYPAGGVNNDSASTATTTTTGSSSAAGASPPPSGAASSPAVDAATAAQRADTAAASATLLRQLGLDELIPQVEDWIRRGLYTSWSQIEAQLLDRSTEAGRAVDRIYPELRLMEEENQRRRAAREPELPPMSIVGIQNFYRQGTDLISQRGLNAAFPDLRATLQGWLVSGKSLVEQAARLDVIEDDVATAISGSAEAMAEFEGWQRFYGVGPTLQAYVAHVLNPATDLPTLARQQAAVRTDRAAGRAGFGDLSRFEAEQVAAWGTSEADAVAGFGDLAALGEVVNPLAGSGEDTIDRGSQLEAAFGGNTFARKRIERRARERRAAFESGGGFAGGREGYTGLGTAQ